MKKMELLQFIFFPIALIFLFSFLTYTATHYTNKYSLNTINELSKSEEISAVLDDEDASIVKDNLIAYVHKKREISIEIFNSSNELHKIYKNLFVASLVILVIWLLSFLYFYVKFNRRINKALTSSSSVTNNP